MELVDKPGRHLTEDVYEEFGYFTKGRILIKKGGKYGYIDNTGKTLIPPEYNKLSLFADHLASAQKERNGKFGIIDDRGKVVLDFLYDMALPLNKDMILIMEKKLIGLLDPAGKTLIPAKYEFISFLEKERFLVQKNKKWSIQKLEADGTLTPLTEHEYDETNRLGDGLIGAKRNDRWGFLDKNGKEVIEFKFSGGGVFNEGKAFVSENGKTICIDKEGKKLFDAPDRITYPFHEGRASYLKFSFSSYRPCISKWGIINEKGQTVTPPRFTNNRAPLFRGGLAAVFEGSMKMGYIDRNGKIAIPPSFESGNLFTFGIASVSQKKKIKLINREGVVLY